MIRTLRDEVERYGPYSLAVESQYDHPMLWGSKRTGPDLARVGEKYSDAWHVAHLVDPRDAGAAIGDAGLRLPARARRSRSRACPSGCAALRAVGVPYTDAMIENAARDALGQALPDSDARRAASSSATARRPTCAPSTATPTG